MNGAIDNVEFSKFDWRRRRKTRFVYVVEVVEINCRLAGCAILSNCRVALICDVDGMDVCRVTNNLNANAGVTGKAEDGLSPMFYSQSAWDVN
jgi:hypothetical protein